MEVFVFGSNLAGLHGAGSALAAHEEYGAPMGLGVGRWSASYAIPTKDCNLKVLPLETIEMYVHQFIEYAASHKEDTFNVVAIGCGLAGFKPRDIAPMFELAPENVNLPEEFLDELVKQHQEAVGE